MMEWIEYDGTNPPADDSRYIMWERRYSNGAKKVFVCTWLYPIPEAIDSTLRYTYVDPPERPKPKCPVCGKEMLESSWDFRRWICERDEETHVVRLSDKEAEKYR